jgi:hypothetical protein
MSIQRISVVGLLASILFATGAARGQDSPGNNSRGDYSRGQDFQQRYAAWQGRAPLGGRIPQATAPPITAEPEVGGEGEVMPAPGTARTGSQRILGDVYNAPQHMPNYNAPWTSSACASCYHNPTFEPAGDQYGTCNFAGGGPLFGTVGGGLLGCGGCGACKACGPGAACCDGGPDLMDSCGGACCNTLVWLRLEALLWWRQGRDFPPLVTTDPATESSTTAGVLPDAHVLFGGARTGTNMQAGGRVDFGTYLNPAQTIGIGDRFFGLGRDSSEFRVASNDVPVLAVPFHDFNANANDALLIAYPGLRTGNISVIGSSSLVGNDVYTKILLCRDCINRWDFITGWNWTRIGDDVALRTRTTIISDPTLPAGTVLTTLDQFRTTNNFNGGILGLQWQRNCGYWTTQMLGRMSIGNMHEVILVSGQSAVNGTVSATPGGVLTAASNIGRRARNEFTAITEVGLNLGYRFAPCTTLNVGYTFMYFNDVLSPANNIDTGVGTASTGLVHPAVLFRHSDFWVQGLNLGITKEF